MRSVLFICTANVCRSPMAEGLFRAFVGDEAAGWRIESAGTWARSGDLASQKAQVLFGELGIDLSAHRSRPVTYEMLRQFNLILTMEEGHKEALQIEFPDAARRVYLLSEMVGEKYDIDDPMGEPTSAYRETLRELKRIFNDGYSLIQKLSQDDDG